MFNRAFKRHKGPFVPPRIKSEHYRLRGQWYFNTKGLDVQAVGKVMDALQTENGYRFDLDRGVALANDPTNPLYPAVEHDPKVGLLEWQKQQLRGLARSLERVQVYDDGQQVITQMFVAVAQLDEPTADEVADAVAAGEPIPERKPGAIVKHVYISDVGMSRDEQARLTALAEVGRNIEWLQGRIGRIDALADPDLKRALDNTVRRIREEIVRLRTKKRQ